MENNEKIDLTKWLDRFYKNAMKFKKIILAIIVVCTLLSLGNTLFRFNTVYSSKAVLIATNSESGNLYATSDENDDLISSFSSLLKSEMMNEVIMESMGVTYLPGYVSVSRVSNTNLIELRVTSQDPQIAYDMIHCILNNYNQVTDIVMSDIVITLFDTPKLASAPDATPNYLKSAAEGFIGGVGISFVLILFLSLVRKTINTNDDVKNVLNLTNLSKIPNISNSSHSSLLLSNPGIHYQFRHAFHELRLCVEQEKKKKKSNVFMITSTMPNEGKSTVSSNLAISLAEKGNHVILVDVDLRNPSVMRIIKDTKMNGSVTDYLKGNCSLAKSINPYLDYSLDVIFGNEFATDAPEQLSKESFSEFIKILKKAYDYVILDVPPLYMMEDALLVAKHCDSAIVVIKQDFVNAYDILDSLEELNEHTNIMGTVLNHVVPSIFDQESSTYGYGYGYGYGRK